MSISNPSAYYSFNNTLVADATGNGNTLTNHSATQTIGKIGQGASFAGTVFTGGTYTSGDYLSNSYTHALPLTIAAWIYCPTDTHAPGAAMIVSKYDTTANQREFKFYVTYASSTTFSLHANISSDGATTTQLFSGTTYACGWHHVALTIASGTVAMYCDAVLDLSASFGSTLFQGTAPFAIGCQFTSGTANSFFNGIVDEVAVYPTALSLSDIQALHTNASGFPFGCLTATSAQFVPANAQYFSLPIGSVPTAWMGARDFSITCWAYFNDVNDDNNQEIISLSNGGFDCAYELRTSFNGIQIVFLDPNTSQQWGAQAGNGLLNHHWHHIAATYQESTGTARLVLDDIQYLAGSGVRPGGSVSYSGSGVPFDIGSRNGNGGLYMDGNLAAIKRFNKVLTTDEITQDWNGGNGVAVKDNQISNLVAGWDFADPNNLGHDSVGGVSLANTTGVTNGIGWVETCCNGFAVFNDAANFSAFDISPPQYMTCPTPIITAPPLTISMWIFARSRGAISGVFAYPILRMGDTDGNNPISQMQCDEFNRLDVGFGNGNIVTTQNGFLFDIWHHVVITHDGTTCNVWIDGVLDGNSGTLPTAMVSTGATGFGNNLLLAPIGVTFNGQMAAVKFFSRIWTTDEIAIDYNAGRGLAAIDITQHGISASNYVAGYDFFESGLGDNVVTSATTFNMTNINGVSHSNGIVGHCDTAPITCWDCAGVPCLAISLVEWGDVGTLTSSNDCNWSLAGTIHFPNATFLVTCGATAPILNVKKTIVSSAEEQTLLSWNGSTAIYSGSADIFGSPTTLVVSEGICPDVNQSVYYLLMQNVVTLLQGIGLSGVDSANVQITKFPKFEETIDTAPFVCVCFSEQPEQIERNGFSGNIAVTYAINVVMIAAGNMDLINGTDVYTKWRQQIRQLFQEWNGGLTTPVTPNAKIVDVRTIMDVAIDRFKIPEGFDFLSVQLQITCSEIRPS